MENRRAYQIILERIASDAGLKQTALACDAKAFTELLRANGYAQVTEEQAAAILGKIRTAFDTEDGELDEDILCSVAGGMASACSLAYVQCTAASAQNNC